MVKCKIGDRFNDLEIISFSGKNNSVRSKGEITNHWLCKCVAEGLNCKKTRIVDERSLKDGGIKNCGNNTCKSQFKNHINKVYERLTVTKYLGITNGFSYWECICVCGTVVKVVSHDLGNGNAKSCGCLQYEIFVDNIGTTYKKALPYKILNNIKKSASKRNIEFNITHKDIWELYEKQDKKCLFSGLPIAFTNNTASVDRIKNNIGYIAGNIQLVHKWINIMKNTLTNDMFIMLCQFVASRSKKIELDSEEQIIKALAEKKLFTKIDRL